MSPDAFKIPNGASTPLMCPETAEVATDVFSDLYSLVFAPLNGPAPAAVSYSLPP
ncbi:hypothetical protein F5J12DRAFT_886848 [Pisolithus orientalis]|uniref:uncharacterized protein n=1 Tax=Pisolithus orientalis TaxID=936130 RepID=UPI002224A387|nr:uncharacterized protein F5J12DRAFT_886848 [Pisolithus orientalis]KAI6035019.1 hypothetical protein F5J12DRAFT_886848 [Pisolithus orientalis]